MSSIPSRDPGAMSYADYLQLDKLLDTQRALLEPAHHDELLFIPTPGDAETSNISWHTACHRGAACYCPLRAP
jgi:hypothetical protein